MQKGFAPFQSHFRYRNKQFELFPVLYGSEDLYQELHFETCERCSAMNPREEGKSGQQVTSPSNERAPVRALLRVSCFRVRPRVNRLLPALMKPERNPLDAATESRHDSLTHPTLPPLEHTTYEVVCFRVDTGELEEWSGSVDR